MEWQDRHDMAWTSIVRLHITGMRLCGKKLLLVPNSYQDTTWYSTIENAEGSHE